MKTTTVAIVDDDRGTRELIADQLAVEDGFECVGLYADAEVAIKGILASEPDIVLMDINMPGMNGIECVSQLKPWLPNTDFVILTVYDEPDFIFQALTAGAVGYLLKRSVGEGLIPALQEASEGGSPMDASIARLVVQSFCTPPSKADRELAELSDRQMEILQLLSRGKAYKVIAEELDLSIHTVQTYIRRIYEKLHVHSRGEAVAKFRGIK